MTILADRNRLRKLVLDDLPFLNDEFVINVIKKWISEETNSWERDNEQDYLIIIFFVFGQYLVKPGRKNEKKAVVKQQTQTEKQAMSSNWNNNRPFKYLVVLTMSHTRVTERSFKSILHKKPFS